MSWFKFGGEREDRERTEEAIGTKQGCDCVKNITMGDMLVWLLSFFILIGLLAILVYQLMCLADLEFDYTNSYETAARVNRFVLPEYFMQGGLCLLFLLTGHWVMALLSLPYLCYNYRLYASRRHLVDMTEIFNMLSHEKKQRVFKLGYLVCLLLFTLLWMIVCALVEKL